MTFDNEQRLACKENEHIRRQRPRLAGGQSILDKYSFIIFTPIEASPPVTYRTSSHTHCYLRSAEPNSEIVDFDYAHSRPQVGSLSENEPRNEGVLEVIFCPQPYSSISSGQLKQLSICCRGRVESRSRFGAKQKPPAECTSCPTGVVVIRSDIEHSRVFHVHPRPREIGYRKTRGGGNGRRDRCGSCRSWPPPAREDNKLHSHPSPVPRPSLRLLPARHVMSWSLWAKRMLRYSGPVVCW